MKILQITYSLASGGAERFVVDLSNELAKNKDNEVHLLVIRNFADPKFKYYLQEVSKDVKCINIGAAKGLCLKSVMGVYKAIKEIRPDIVHAHCDLTLLYLPSLLYKKAKYVHTLHTIAEKNIVHKKLRTLQRYIYSKHVQGITISNLCQKSFVDFYNLEGASLCIPNGCKKMVKTQVFEDVLSEVKGYKNGRDIPVFIHVARYFPIKNQKRLFDAIEKLHNDGKDFLLLVLGRNYEKSPYMHLNSTDYVKILGEKHNVADYLACADYFLLSSDWEGLPISILEAMSMGCIPISTPAGGVVDVIKDGKNGLLCPTFDSTDYYTTVAKVFDKNFTIGSETVVNDYLENYTMEVCAKKYYNAYKSKK